MNDEKKLPYNENIAITLVRNRDEATPLRYDMIDEIAGDRLEIDIHKDSRKLVTSKHGDSNLWKFGIRKGRITYWIKLGRVQSLIQTA